MCHSDYYPPVSIGNMNYTVRTPAVFHALSSLCLIPGDDNTFQAPVFPTFMPRIYGGQLLGQATVCSLLSLDDPNRLPHSLSASFLRPGTVEQPLYFHVNDTVDGRSFSQRVISGNQNNHDIFLARVSLQKNENIDMSSLSAPSVEKPENLPSSIDLFSSSQHPLAQTLHDINFADIRHSHSTPALYINADTQKKTFTTLWLRLREELPQQTPQFIHRALLAYAADQFMLEPALRLHGLSWMHPHLSIASLDHNVWWHRNLDITQWIVAHIELMSASDNRYLTRATFFQDDAHIATMTQEGVMRFTYD
ncbi:MAG: thioesterase family protein [Actinomycetaceae bacterium]|nr:thioesterase family protein [Actinomycetaceae bacterium]